MKKIKNMLLCSLALIVVPVWAGDAPSASGTETGVNIALKGSAKGVRALVADLEKDAVYKEAACSGGAVKSGKAAKITCVKADGALLTFLSKNAVGVRWNISAVSRPLTAVTLKSVSTSVTCPTGCVYMSCPPPTGPYACCKTTTYQRC